MIVPIDISCGDIFSLISNMIPHQQEIITILICISSNSETNQVIARTNKKHMPISGICGIKDVYEITSFVTLSTDTRTWEVWSVLQEFPWSCSIWSTRECDVFTWLFQKSGFPTKVWKDLHRRLHIDKNVKSSLKNILVCSSTRTVNRSDIRSDLKANGVDTDHLKKSNQRKIW